MGNMPIFDISGNMSNTIYHSIMTFLEFAEIYICIVHAKFLFDSYNRKDTVTVCVMHRFNIISYFKKCRVSAPSFETRIARNNYSIE